MITVNSVLPNILQETGNTMFIKIYFYFHHFSISRFLIHRFNKEFTPFTVLCTASNFARNFKLDIFLNNLFIEVNT